MQFVGITGNMGSGKTTSAALLKELGAIVLSADVFARKVVEPGENAYKEIVAHFGREILRNDRSINRKRLADIVFDDRKQLIRLNEITHSRVRQLRDSHLKVIYRQKPESLVVFEVPLLFENNLQHQFQKVIVVRIDESVQLTRLLVTRRFSERAVKLRLENQMNQKEKVSRADYVVDNSGLLEDLKEQLVRIHSELLHLPQLPLAEIL